MKIAKTYLPIWKIFSSPFERYRRLMVEKGDVVKIYTPKPIYYVNDADFIYHILANTNTLFNKQTFDFRLFNGLIGRGLVTNEGHEWKSVWEKTRPYFNSKYDDRYAEYILRQTSRLKQQWAGHADKNTKVDISRDMTGLTFKVISSVVFGVDNDDCEIAEEMESLRLSAYEGFWLLFPFIPVKTNRKIKTLHKKFDQLIDRLGKESIAAGHECLFNTLRKTLPHAKLYREIRLILFAGYSTMVALLTWIFYTLSVEPQCANKVHREIQTLLGGRAPGLGDISKLNYTGSFVKEVLRLYPPAWLMTRNCVQTHDFDGLRIAKNRTILIFPWMLHRHPKYWSNPDTFMPERFSRDSDSINTNAFIPFGLGPRVCIGKRLGLMEAHLVLADILRDFRVVQNQRVDLKIVTMLSPKPEKPVMLNIERINGARDDSQPVGVDRGAVVSSF